jgi:hypothetical protein
MYPDGAGLYLQVGSKGARSWIYRYARDGRPRYMGLGSLSAVTLAEARQRAADARRLLSAGEDPIAARDAQRAAQRAATATAMTFRQCAEAYVAAHRPSWRSAKHVSQWANTLEAYVNPILGDLPVRQVDTGLVMKSLEPI